MRIEVARLTRADLTWRSNFFGETSFESLRVFNFGQHVLQVSERSLRDRLMSVSNAKPTRRLAHRQRRRIAQILLQ